MNSVKLKDFVLRWLICTVAVLIAEHIVSGIHYEGWVDLLVATLILGLLNYFIKPLLMILSMPLLIFTLGFYVSHQCVFVINRKLFSEGISC